MAVESHRRSLRMYQLTESRAMRAELSCVTDTISPVNVTCKPRDCSRDYAKRTLERIAQERVQIHININSQYTWTESLRSLLTTIRSLESAIDYYTGETKPKDMFEFLYVRCFLCTVIM